MSIITFFNNLIGRRQVTNPVVETVEEVTLEVSRVRENKRKLADLESKIPDLTQTFSNEYEKIHRDCLAVKPATEFLMALRDSETDKPDLRRVLDHVKDAELAVHQAIRIIEEGVTKNHLTKEVGETFVRNCNEIAEWVQTTKQDIRKKLGFA